MFSNDSYEMTIESNKWLRDFFENAIGQSDYMTVEYNMEARCARNGTSIILYDTTRS